MLKNISWAPTRRYKSSSDWEPLQFYLDALSESKTLDIYLGYFSSSAISYLALGFAKFISSGGRVRMIINDILSAKDRAVLKNVKDGYIYQIPFDIQNFSELRARLQDYDLHFFQCLGWLIQNNRIEIVAIKPLEKRGIAHYKSGIFSDGVDEIGFSGSCNFTARGLLENIERIDITLPSDGEPAQLGIRSDKEEFEQVFTGKANHVKYLDVDEIKAAVATEFGNSDIDELLITENELLERKKETFAGKKIKSIIDTTKARIRHIIDSPHFPHNGTPRDYQIEAYNNWLTNDQQGIFAMATGTGKTITAMNCVLNEYFKTGSYKAVILVPTTILVEQWTKEAKQFNFKNIIQVSSKNQRWKVAIQEKITEATFGINSDYIIITTYASFNKKAFQDYFKQIHKDTILIADEAHNVGSPATLKILPNIQQKKRIGLSATPKRIYDPEGSDKMEGFFNDHEPYTYTFTMERAIEEKILCKYFYYPYIVTLMPEELEKYYAISRELRRYFHMGDLDKNEAAQKLLMDRKRIIHQAANKLSTFKSILKRIEQEKGKIEYSLVYAPEGYYSDDEYIDEEEFNDLDEENRIIDFYSSIVRKNYPETTVTQYTSDSEDKENVLRQFELGNINLLLSMKCLDEGVDIPRTELAIFCSSTGNPRQFIQRRGRILRRHENKSFATIYDMVVIPSLTQDPDDFELEQSLVKKELERVVNFAYMAINKYPAMETFKDVCEQYQLNLDTIQLELQ
jgi:superfamily II DNA or RNA helicase